MITLRKVTYQTADGETFDSKQSAKAHEMTKIALTSLYKVLETSVKTGRADAVIK